MNPTRQLAQTALEIALKSHPPLCKPLALMTVAALLSLAPPAQAQTATEAELMRRLDQMAGELAQLKAQLGALQQQRGSRQTR